MAISFYTTQTIKFITVALCACTFGSVVYMKGKAQREAHNLQTINESLSKAEELFNNFATAGQAEKTQIISHLSTAYRQLKHNHNLSKDSQGKAARIFYIYGQCLYGENMQASRQMFKLSLAMETSNARQLLSSDKLEELPKLLTEEGEHAFTQLDQTLLEGNQKELALAISKLDYARAYTFASALKGLGFTSQNISQFSTAGNVTFFEKTYSLATDIFNQLNTPDSRWQVAEIIYNTSRFVHYLRQPEDVMGALRTLTALTPYFQLENGSLRARVMQAQICNITQIEMSKLPTASEVVKRLMLKMQFGKVQEAAMIAESTPEFPSQLKTMFTNNRAAFAMDCLEAGLPEAEVATWASIQSWTEIVLKTIRENGYNHLYHPGYLINAARCAIRCNEMQKASDLLTLAGNLIDQKFSDTVCTAKDLSNIAKYRAMLTTQEAPAKDV